MPHKASSTHPKAALFVLSTVLPWSTKADVDKTSLKDVAVIKVLSKFHVHVKIPTLVIATATVNLLRKAY